MLGILTIRLSNVFRNFAPFYLFHNHVFHLDIFIQELSSLPASARLRHCPVAIKSRGLFLSHSRRHIGLLKPLAAHLEYYQDNPQLSRN